MPCLSRTVWSRRWHGDNDLDHRVVIIDRRAALGAEAVEALLGMVVVVLGARIRRLELEE